MSILAGLGTVGSWLGSAGSWIGSNIGWGNVLTAGASGLGSLLGVASSSDMAHEQRKTMREYMKRQAEENAIARQWSEDMSNTAHQREVADLKAAGLNPVLSATGGNGAVTPSTSSNILGASDSSAGIAHEGRMKAIETMVGLADRLSQLNLNSALAKKASAEASSALAKAGLDQARTGQEQVKSNLYGFLGNAANALGINLGGQPSGNNSATPFVRNSADNSGGPVPSLVSNRGLVQDIKDTVKGLFGDNPTYYPATRVKSEKRDHNSSFVVPNTPENLSNPEMRSLVNQRVFWDPKKNEWYYPRPDYPRQSYEKHDYFTAPDTRGYWRKWRKSNSRPYHK